MNTRKDIINNYYSDVTKEDLRLNRTRHGQLEYLTTMHYINKFFPKPCKVLEIGAATGRYSIALAKNGYDVVAIELGDNHFDLLNKRVNELKNNKFKNIVAYKEDALNLTRFNDNTFDLTFLLGPMCHLYKKQDIMKAIWEAIRVTKSAGIVMTSFLSAHFLMLDRYYDNNRMNGIKETFTSNFKTRLSEKQIITRFDINEFESLFNELNVKHITTLTTDGIIKHIEDRGHLKMDDEEFNYFLKYHLNFCEKREMLGNSCHLLHICKKL